MGTTRVRGGGGERARGASLVVGQRAYECVCLEQRHFIDLIALGFEAHVCCGIEFDQAGLHSCGRSSLFSLRLMIIIAASAQPPHFVRFTGAAQHAQPNIGCPCIILLPLPSRQTSLRRPLQMHGALPCFGYTQHSRAAQHTGRPLIKEPVCADTFISP